MQLPQKKFKLIVLGGSAGSVDAIFQIVPNLKPDFSLPIVIVLHRPATSKEGFITETLHTKSPLRMKEAEEKEPVAPATIYLAPADYHLLIENDFTFSLDASEKVLFSRPSIDVTFESAAEQLGDALIGILLTGANSDGARGIEAIALQGGLTIAQDPATAVSSAMPQAAINTGKVQHVMTIEEIITFLNSL